MVAQQESEKNLWKTESKMSKNCQNPTSDPSIIKTTRSKYILGYTK